MRRALVAAVLCAAAFLAPSAALAQDGPPPPSPAGAEGPAPAALMRVRAVDYAAYMRAVRAGSTDAVPGPLASRTVKVVYRGADGKSSEIAVRTDADGRLDLPLAGIPNGAALLLFVPDESRTDNWPAYAAHGVRADPNARGDVPFLAVHAGASPVAASMLNYVVTVPDREEGHGSLRVNLIASVRNDSDALWLGPRDADRASRATLRFPFPAGMQVVAVRAGDRDLPIEVVPAGAGQEVVIHEPLLPSALQDDTAIRVVITGPFSEDTAYDFSFDAPFGIDAIGLNLEAGVLRYDDGAGVTLTDGGPNPPMGGSQKATHGWRGEHVHQGQRVNLRFSFGTPPIDRRVWTTLGAIALAAGGAAILAKVLASRRAGAALAAIPASPESLDDRAARRAELDRRLQRGEITSFEHAARTKLLDAPTAAHRPAKTTHVSATHAASPDSASRIVAEIAARAGTADADTLRRDVATLVSLVRGLLR